MQGVQSLHRGMNKQTPEAKLGSPSIVFTVFSQKPFLFHPEPHLAHSKCLGCLCGRDWKDESESITGVCFLMEWLDWAGLETEFRDWGLDGGAERELS